MTYYQISSYYLLNEVDMDHVDAIIDSIIGEGWKGLPILVYNEELLTGSHRLSALRTIEEKLNNEEFDFEVASKLDKILNSDIAVDITEDIRDNIEEGMEIDYAELGPILQGTWLEEFRSEIVEW